MIFELLILLRLKIIVPCYCCIHWSLLVRHLEPKLTTDSNIKILSYFNSSFVNPHMYSSSLRDTSGGLSPSLNDFKYLNCSSIKGSKHFIFEILWAVY